MYGSHLSLFPFIQMSTIPRVFGHICIKSIKYEKECSTVGASPLAFRWSFAQVYFSLSSYGKVGEGGKYV